MAGYQNTETDSSDSDSLKDEDFIPPESPPKSPPESPPKSPPESPRIPPPHYPGSDYTPRFKSCFLFPYSALTGQVYSFISPSRGIRAALDPWSITEASDAAGRRERWFVTPYVPMMCVYSPIPHIEYPQATSDGRGYLTIPFPLNTATTWLSNSPSVTPTINALGSIPAPYLSGYEGTMWNSGRFQLTRTLIHTSMQPRRGRGRGGGVRGLTRRVTMFFGPVSRPWTRYSSDLYSTISNLSLNAITLSEASELQEEKRETRALCISAPDEKVESGASSISDDSTPEPLGLIESTEITDMMSDVKMDTNLNQTSNYGPKPAAVMQPTPESSLTLEAGPINVDPVSSLFQTMRVSGISDPQPEPLIPITPNESSSSLIQSNNGKKPGLIESNMITQNPGPSSEADAEPTSRSSKRLKLCDFLSPKLSEALIGNVPEMPSEESSSLEDGNSPPPLEMDSPIQWPKLAPVKLRPIPQSEIHMHLQWPTIGHVRRAARTAIALQAQPSDEMPPADNENAALEAEMASVQMPPDLDNLAFLALFAAEVWPELPPGDPELMDLISRILRETWLLLDPEDRQSLVRLAALCAWPQRPESENPD